MKNKFLIGMTTAGTLLGVACAEKVDVSTPMEQQRQPIVSNKLLHAKTQDFLSNQKAEELRKLEDKLTNDALMKLKNILTKPQFEMLDTAKFKVHCQIGLTELVAVDALKDMPAPDVEAAEEQWAAQEKDGKISVLKLQEKARIADFYKAQAKVDCAGGGSQLISLTGSSPNFDVDVMLSAVDGVELRNISVKGLTKEERAARIAEAKKQISELKLKTNVSVEILNLKTRLAVAPNTVTLSMAANREALNSLAAEADCSQTSDVEATEESCVASTEASLQQRSDSLTVIDNTVAEQSVTGDISDLTTSEIPSQLINVADIEAATVLREKTMDTSYMEKMMQKQNQEAEAMMNPSQLDSVDQSGEPAPEKVEKI